MRERKNCFSKLRRADEEKWFINKQKEGKERIKLMLDCEQLNEKTERFDLFAEKSKWSRGGKPRGENWVEFVLVLVLGVFPIDSVKLTALVEADVGICEC